MTERMTAQTPSQVRAYHEARYKFAVEYARDKAVIDVACGTGYGSQILASNARSVVSVDPRAVPTSSLGSFVRCYGEEIPFTDQFDLAVSFETIEHTISPRVFLYRLWQSLKPGGELLMSFPNKWGESLFHLHDTDVRTLAIIEEFFDIERVFGQNRRSCVSPQLIASGPPSFWVENILVHARRKNQVSEVHMFSELYAEVDKKQLELSRTIRWKMKRLIPRTMTALKRRLALKVRD